MILVGSMFGIFADIPLIVSRRSLLNINLGGALIPLIIACALIYKRKFGIVKIIVGVAAVSALAYSISRYEPGMGIIAEFPYYLFPSLLALLLSIALMRGYKNRIPYAYSSAVLGTLIGADLVRIPMLLEDGVLGSIGGAGAMDLVYLSGLIAVIPLVMYYYYQFPLNKAKDPMDEAHRMFRKGRLIDGVNHARYALERELWRAARLITRATGDRFHRSNYGVEVIPWLGLHPLLIQDYHKLKYGRLGNDYQKMIKTFKTARLLRESVALKTKKRFSSVLRRIFAYVVDLFLTSVPLIIVFLYLIRRQVYYTGRMSPMFFAIFFLAISIQFIYFTLFEWYFGKSIGKMLIGIEVVSDDYGDITFMQSAARNSARYADMLLLFYVISLILIISGADNKRIGDYIAGTKVVKVK